MCFCFYFLPPRWSVYVLFYVILIAGPPRIRSTLTGEDFTNRSVSLGTASDVVVRLQCRVGGSEVSRLANPPRWNRVQSGGLTFVENDSIVEISPVRLSSAVSLQCIFNYPDENRFIDARVDITKSKHLYTHDV